MLLRITDGTTTLTLSGSGTYLGATYFPAPASGKDTITETFPLILEGTEAAIRSAVNDIEQLFQAARARADRLAPRVFAEYRPLDSGEIFRSEIFDGGATWNQAPAKRFLAGTLNTVEVGISWIRSGLWEGALAELYLSSNTLTERTGGVTVYNNDNVSNTNWIGIAANRVVGTRPAPVKLRITNASGSSLSWRNFYIGNNVNSAPAAADVWLLGSEAAGGAAASWVSATTHNDLLWVFPLSTTLLGQTLGRSFRIIAAFTSVTANVNLRAAIGAYLGSVYVPVQYNEERLTTAKKLFDLGELPLPPGGYNAATAAAALAITGRYTGGSGSGTIDFVQLMPTDSFRKLTQINYAAANGTSIELDDIEGAAYLLSGADKYPIVRTSGGLPLTVFPEQINRLHILFDEDAGFTAGRAMTVQAWYRPIYDVI
jgi:hypothetical protein